MKSLSLFLCYLLTASCFAQDFLSDRIGSGKPDSVPIELQVTEASKSYKVRIVGKDDIVGALITGENKAQNLRLIKTDLDILASLKATDKQPNEKDLILQCKATSKASFSSLRLASDEGGAVLVRRLIYIFNLPEYCVQDGDTFSEILMTRLNGKFTKKELLDVNPGLDPDRVFIGQRIKLPEKPPAQQIGSK